MSEVASAFVTLVPSFKGGPATIQRQLAGPVGSASSRVGRDAGGRMSKGMGAVIGGAATKIFAPLAAAAAGVAIFSFTKKAILEAQEAGSATAITERIIKQTGKSAKVTASDVDSLTRSLALKTGVEKTAVREGSNVLLTFKNIRNETGKGNKVFDRANGLMLDMASVFGGDAKQAATQLGKALDDPTKGVSALARVGVTFSKKEKEKIKTLQESGDTLGAQRLILEALESQVGGTAEASADATAKMSNAFREMREKIGEKLLPVVERLSDWVTKTALPAFEGLFNLIVDGDYTKALREAFGWEEDSSQVEFLFKLRDGAKAFWGQVKRLWTWLTERLWPAIKEAADKIMPPLREAFDDLKRAFGGVTDEMDGGEVTWDKVGTIITDILIPAVAKFAEVYLPWMIRQWAKVVTAVKIVIAVFRAIMHVFSKVAIFLLDSFAKIMRGFADMLRAISVVPGFGWAKKAADKMDGAASKAETLSRKLDAIDRNIDIGISLGVTGPSRVKIDMPDGTAKYVNAGIVGMRARGGRVRAGQPYVVGEERPELFVPKTDGYIAPSVPSGINGLGGGGGGVFHLYDADGTLLGTMRGAAKAEVASQARGVLRGTR